MELLLHVFLCCLHFCEGLLGLRILWRVAALALECTGLLVHVPYKENLLTLLDGFKLVGILEIFVQVFWPNLALNGLQSF